METCVLPCRLDGASLILIQWVKTDPDRLVHAFQDGTDQLERQAETFRGRTSLFPEQISGGNASLQLSHVKVSDQGSYLCQTFTSSSGGKTWVQLSVKGPVSFLHLELKGDVLVCSSEGIYPQPAVTWTPDSAHQTQTRPMGDQLYSVSSSLALELRPPQRFTCNISTTHSWKSATYSLNPPVEMSSDVTLPCSSSSAPSAPVKSLSWTFNRVQSVLSRSGADVTYGAPWRPFVERLSESGALSLKELSPEQEGEYLCEVHTQQQNYISSTQLRRTKETAEGPGAPAAVIGVSVCVVLVLAGVVVFFLWKRRQNKKAQNGAAEEQQTSLEERGDPAVLENLLQDNVGAPEEIIRRSSEEMKSTLTQKFKFLTENIRGTTEKMEFDEGFIELCITVGDSGQNHQEHEVLHMETQSRRAADETTVPCQDMFKPRPHSPQPIRLVLTKGVAGVGKTVLTQKLSLDWAEGRAHQDLQLLFPFTFRDLNVLRDTQFSLVELLHHFFSPSKDLCSFQQLQVLFIFDGLDECRLPLDFGRTRVLSDPTESASVHVLLVNLIRGSLLPSALLWITTRPAAANQIPAECVSMVTEVRGFADPQKEQYFRKRFRDQATVVISHIKSVRSLHIMSHIPIFCWILSKVLQKLLEQTEPELPRTLTQMYVHFLVVQAKVQNIKYQQGSGEDLHWTPETREMVKSLGKVAFEQLQKGNLIFYESDLSECGLDAAAASVYSGVFTQVFREEPGLYQDKVYCFIHLSVQEFLAALHVHQTFYSSGENLLETPHSSESPDPEAFYRSAVDQALQSPNGHLDLFLRFLLGLSLPTNQNLLQVCCLQETIKSRKHMSSSNRSWMKRVCLRRKV
ncbi:hypothetical protein NL108_004627 [Boleophthalmus pectinirostris]|nr:hypothetical protein NL108_004627 [Boleophthalmus pectinirostris]